MYFKIHWPNKKHDHAKIFHAFSQHQVQTDTIGHHFNLPNHNGISDATIHVVDFIHMHPDSYGSVNLRRTIERNWQHKLHTIAPQGLNIQE